MSARPDEARAAARDEVALLTRSLADARREHAQGELDDDALASIERRDGQRLADARARLASLGDADVDEAVHVRTAPLRRRRPRWLLAVAAACAVVVALVLDDPFGGAARGLPVTRGTTLVGLLTAGEQALATTPPSFSRALTAFDAALALSPRDPEALVEGPWCRYELGIGHGDLAEERTGAAGLRRAARLVPHNAAAHLYVGITLWQLDHDRAAAYREVRRAAHLPETGVVAYDTYVMMSALAPRRPGR